ncbi:MAG: leucine-rich repeat protein [Bacteroidales bacterium]|nr:leucine-rich repeat protein [Bacteroidales bacterium]
MKYKILYITVLLLTFMAANSVRAEYYFSAQSPSGHTLYFNYTANGVKVGFPGTTTDIPYSGYAQPKGNLIIPSMIEHAGRRYVVDAIDRYAFKGCTGLTSVQLPNTIQSIGECAFYGCSGLITVQIPESVTAIGREAFFQVPNIVYSEDGTATGRPWGARNFCGFVSDNFVFADSTLRTITGYVGLDSTAAIPHGVDSIAPYAVYECTRLKSITLPATIKHIGNYAFAFCNLLSEITIPDSVTAIGERAFHYCSALANLTLGYSVQTLGENAFCYCSSLRTIVLPNSLRSINRYCFYHCDNLREATFGTQLHDIGFSAFAYCAELDSLYMQSWFPPTLDANAFEQTPAVKTIHVPCNRTIAYADDLGQQHTYVEAGASVGLTAANAIPGQGTVTVWTNNNFTAECDSSATVVATPNSGYHFDHWSDGSTDNPYTLHLTRDTLIFAYYSGNGSGVGNVVMEAAFGVAGNDNRITITSVSDGQGGEARVYDITGRQVAALPLRQGAGTPPLPTGIYLVASTNYPAVKVAVMP